MKTASWGDVILFLLKLLAFSAAVWGVYLITYLLLRQLFGLVGA